MWLFGSLALLLLIGEGAGARSGGKRRGGDAVASARSGNGSVFEGSFTARDSSLCTWTASGEKTFALRIACESEARGKFTCEYAGEPAACSAYGTGARRYWRQVGRALAKQKQLCADERAVVRAGMCVRAPPAAHFRLARPETGPKTTTTASVDFPESTTRAPECAESADHRRLAEEKCGEAWASICTFLFTIVQSGGDC
ncbi:fibroblast growth factor-binding protein 1 [Colossoma macropomum]|uniref:fibroblast growth factor-binding protein 1 n=1 Tax=Colossoma macropomum TaxID=42526 RepID=UPI00186532C5|nr:fibroblast growth factor-binding protein 1 [Colossoma macropomum]